jgi:hypothetical protein
MRLPRVRLTIWTLLVPIVVVAIPVALFRAGPRAKARNNEQAVEIASALVMQGDANYRPEKHKARVYRECQMTPMTVDFYPQDAAFVVKRVKLTDQGDRRGPWTFTQRDRVTSIRDGPGLYILDRLGKASRLVPWWTEGGRAK